MKSIQDAVVKCALFLRICGSVAARGGSQFVTSRASPGNHILQDEQLSTVTWGDLVVSSDIPVTVQRYTGDATLPARGGCEGHPLEESEGIILVTSDCDTSVTTITPKISLVKRLKVGGIPRSPR